MLTTSAPVYKKIPVSKPGPDEILINIKYSGVCHTDLLVLNDTLPAPRKNLLVGGHEGAGVVVARGDLVTEIEVGDHAGISGYTVPASTAHIAITRTSLFATRLSSPDIPSMEQTSNMLLRRLRMGPEFLKSAISRKWLQFFAQESPSTRA